MPGKLLNDWASLKQLISWTWTKTSSRTSCRSQSASDCVTKPRREFAICWASARNSASRSTDRLLQRLLWSKFAKSRSEGKKETRCSSTTSNRRLHKKICSSKRWSSKLMRWMPKSTNLMTFSAFSTLYLKCCLSSASAAIHRKRLQRLSMTHKSDRALLIKNSSWTRANEFSSRFHLPRGLSIRKTKRGCRNCSLEPPGARHWLISAIIFRTATISLSTS